MHHHGLYHIHDCLQSYVHRSQVSTVHSMFLCGPSSCMHILSLLYCALGLHKVSLTSPKCAT